MSGTYSHDQEARARRARRNAIEGRIIKRITKDQAAAVLENRERIQAVRTVLKGIKRAVGGPGVVNLHGFDNLRSELNTSMNLLKAGIAASGVNYAQIDPGMIASEDFFSPDHFIRRDALKDRRSFWSKILEAAAAKMK